MDFFYLLLFGYLVGSISPGYFFGKIFKGIDIRNYGSEETGATNAYRIIGSPYGIIAGILDALKAIFAFYVAVSGLKLLNFETLSPDLAILVGLAAIFGHIFPFYLGFRGGRGAASLFGLNFIVLIYNQSFYALLLLVGSLIYSVIIAEERKKVYTAPLGRTLAKTSALFLPISYIWFSRELLVLALTFLLSAFLFFDIIRFLTPKINRWYMKSKKFAKEKEIQRFSGYTLFLLSAFLLFNFFPKEITVISLIFFIVGDVLAPAGQIRYMPHQRIFGDLSRQTGKTLGGALVIFVFALLAGLFLKSLTPLTLSLNLIIAGGLATALLDQLSVFVDDNLLVPLGTASLLWIISLAIGF